MKTKNLFWFLFKTRPGKIWFGAIFVFSFLLAIYVGDPRANMDVAIAVSATFWLGVSVHGIVYCRKNGREM